MWFWLYSMFLVLSVMTLNSACVMLAMFASSLWFPAMITLLLFEVIDYIRIFSHFFEGNDRYPVTKGFLIYYTVSTAFESLCVVSCGGKVFVTSLTEHMYLHSWPSLLCTFSLLLLILKRLRYLRRGRLVPCFGILMILWVIKISLLLVNLHDAVNLQLYLVFVAPGIMALDPVCCSEEADFVVFALDRSN